MSWVFLSMLMYTYIMRKILVIMICFLVTFAFSSLHINAYTIKGGISYTVSKARQIAFENVNYKIDIYKYKEFFIDKNFAINQKVMLKDKKKYKNRYLTKFSKGEYAIRYKNQPSHAYYYDSSGKLCYIDIDLNSSYPKQRVTYNINGILDSVTLDTSSNEQFIFDTNKQLIAHWIGNNCYDDKGVLIDTRH